MPADTAPKRLALVTGTSSGIGRAFARRLAAQGRDLIDTAIQAQLAAFGAQSPQLAERYRS